MKRIILIIFFIGFWLSFSLAADCPVKTTAGYNYIDFVGKLDGLGGDTAVKVWFEYGLRKNNLNKKTNVLKLTEPQVFCLREKKLKPCTTYYYRAAAQNSAGVNYGETKTIKTLCRMNKNNNRNLINNKNESQRNEIKWVIF